MPRRLVMAECRGAIPASWDAQTMILHAHQGPSFPMLQDVFDPDVFLLTPGESNVEIMHSDSNKVLAPAGVYQFGFLGTKGDGES